MTTSFRGLLGGSWAPGTSGRAGFLLRKYCGCFMHRQWCDVLTESGGRGALLA